MQTTKIITDPIYRVMSFGSDTKFIECFKVVMDTKVFQRLRRITQLGLASYVFPGATHSRFSHCLGSAHLARIVLFHLRERKSIPEITEAEFNSVVFAAMLHDLGHGPFSHSFERILKGREYAAKHEDWTKLLISHEQSEIRRCLEGHGMEVDAICSVFDEASETGLRRPLKQIVSSQLDVDRMDYLVRDSHFAGISVGRFDVDYLIQSLTIVQHGAGGPETLGINLKGVKAYEGFVLARQLMNRTLYYHHNIQILEFMIERFLRLVIETVADTKGAALELVPEYLKLIATAGSTWRDKSTFMNAVYPYYSCLTEDAVWTLIGAAAEGRLSNRLRAPANQILTREILPHFNIRSGKADLLKEALLEEGLTEQDDFHILAAETTMYKARGDQRVFVQDEYDNIDEILRHSETISAFRDRPETESFLIVLNSKAISTITGIARQGQFIFAGKEAHAEQEEVATPTLDQGIQRIPPRREGTPDQSLPLKSGSAE